MADLIRQNELWVDKHNKILSFHFVANYLHKSFKNYTEFIYYVVANTQRGYKVQ